MDRIKPGRGITEWSRKSRAAMCRTFAELDYTPLVECGRVPAMVTLTYPDDWECVPPDGASVKRHMVLWRRRFQREWGEPARHIWKLEFQRRGAPHIHLWMAPPQIPGRSGRLFWEWLSQEWADIVAHPNPEQRARHLLAGTAVDVLNGLRACDPKRLAIYFTKHSSPNRQGDTEYQHIVPDAWRKPGHGQGRFWGVHGLQRATAVVEIAQDAYLTARRIFRRWSRSQATYGGIARNFPTDVLATDGPPGSSTGRQPDREITPTQGPPTTTPVQPRRTCRWLRPRERFADRLSLFFRNETADPKRCGKAPTTNPFRCGASDRWSLVHILRDRHFRLPTRSTCSSRLQSSAGQDRRLIVPLLGTLGRCVDAYV